MKADRYFDVVLRQWVKLECEIKLTEEKPYPNEHACRKRNPGDFQSDTFVRQEREHNGKRYDVIMARLKGETTLTEQAYRYPKDVWEVVEARKHCEEHDGISFEPASSKSPQYFHAKIQKDSIREVDGHLQIEGIASSVLDEEDRDHEFVEMDGFGDAIKHYLNNPVLLYMHRMYEPVGRTVAMTIDKLAGFWIRGMISNAPDVESIRVKIREGVLRALSIGFLPVEGKMIDDVYHWLKFEIIEVSVVSIGANRHALFNVAKGLRYGSDLYIAENHIANIVDEKLKALAKSGDKDAGVTGDHAPHLHKPPHIKSAPIYTATEAAIDKLAAQLKTDKLGRIASEAENILRKIQEQEK